MTTEILQELKEGTCDANDQCSFNCRDLDTVQIFKNRSNKSSGRLCRASVDDTGGVSWTHCHAAYSRVRGQESNSRSDDIWVRAVHLHHAARRVRESDYLLPFRRTSLYLRLLPSSIRLHAGSVSDIYACCWTWRLQVNYKFYQLLASFSGFARVGALITPFIAQVLIRQSQVAAASTYGIVALLRLKIFCL